MDIKILVKFLEQGIAAASTHALTAASIKETKTVDDHLRYLKTDDLMTFDVGAFSEGVQPAEAALLVQALRTARVSPAQIGKAIDASSLSGYYQRMLHDANSGT